MAHAHAEYVLLLKALADETRLKIIGLLSQEEMCACKLLESFAITQPTLSYHMKILMACQLVQGRRDGTWMRYWINQEKFQELTDFLDHLIEEKREA